MMDVEIIRIRRKRKYMVLRLRKDGTFSLRVSSYVTRTQIDSFLDKNEEWMDRVKEKFDRASQMRESAKFEDGEKRPLFGDEYEIQIVKGRRCLHFDGTFHLSENCRDNGRQVFRNYYRNELKAYLQERLVHFSSIMNCTYSSFSVGSATQKWGSCSNREKLRFTLILAMAPRDVVDYVIIHELVHTKISSHGKNFWMEVEKFMPDWRARRKWLRDNRDRLLSYV